MTRIKTPGMNKPRIVAASEGDYRYYKRAFNFGFVWNLQHGPRQKLIELFLQTFKPTVKESILDLGTANLAEPLENIFEYYYPYKHRIVAAGIEDCSFLEHQYPGLKFVQLQPRERLPFADNQFDIVFSNATIEHVGSHREQALFVAELLRVSRKAFIATPNRWFPIELHTRLPFVHWLPPAIFRAIIRRLGFEFYSKEENLNLLSSGGMLSLVPRPNAWIVSVKYNYFFGLPCNVILIIVKDAKHT